ncbi:hypothetical protein F4779DRAFT_612709 [Xylariaceae sp. FL0662B]|nr:hypothetical protein F4779DRAFT_612709 [Xylariaceae sp. FL0662B]
MNFMILGVYSHLYDSSSSVPSGTMISNRYYDHDRTTDAPEPASCKQPVAKSLEGTGDSLDLGANLPNLASLPLTQALTTGVNERHLSHDRAGGGRVGNGHRRIIIVIIILIFFIFDTICVLESPRTHTG